MIATQFAQTMSMVTDALLVHLNVEQHVIINASSVLVSLNKTTVEGLSSRIIVLNSNAHVRLPSELNLNVTSNTTVALRVRRLLSLRSAHTEDRQS